MFFTLKVFDAIKPFLLNDAYSKIRTLVDQNLDKMVGDYGKMPNSISPIDNVSIAQCSEV